MRMIITKIMMSTYMQNLMFLAWKMTEIWLFSDILLGLVLYGLVWFCMVLCVGIVWIYFHAKFRASSLKNDRDIAIWVIFGLVWFVLVWFGMVWFGLVWFCMVWYVCIVWMYYHAKFLASSLKIDWVMAILVIFGLVWFGMVLSGMICGYCLDRVPWEISSF